MDNKLNFFHKIKQFLANIDYGTYVKGSIIVIKKN